MLHFWAWEMFTFTRKTRRHAEGVGAPSSIAQVPAAARTTTAKPQGQGWTWQRSLRLTHTGKHQTWHPDRALLAPQATSPPRTDCALLL